MPLIVLLLILAIFGAGICWLVGRRTPATYLEDVAFGLVLLCLFVIALSMGGYIGT